MMSHHRLHNLASDPSTLWIVREKTPEGIRIEQVTSEPPENHFWKVVPDSSKVVPGADLLESYKHIEIED